MGLFKDFKDDFSQAVNEMMPGADAPEKENKAEDLVAVSYTHLTLPTT